METPIEDLSLTEQKYAKYLIELCKTITEEYAEVEDDE
jgi:endonuclease III